MGPPNLDQVAVRNPVNKFSNRSLKPNKGLKKISRTYLKPNTGQHPKTGLERFPSPTS